MELSGVQRVSLRIDHDAAHEHDGDEI